MDNEPHLETEKDKRARDELSSQFWKLVNLSRFVSAIIDALARLR